MSQHKLSAIVNSAAAGVIFKLSDTPPTEGTEVGKLRSIQIDNDIWGIEASGSSPIRLAYDTLVWHFRKTVFLILSLMN